MPPTAGQGYIQGRMEGIGIQFKDNSEYSFSIDRDPNTKVLTATTPKSTHEFTAGQVQVTKINGITVTVAGVHTHGPGDLYGLSETDKNSAITAGRVMYVMAPDGGLYLYDPADKATQKRSFCQMLCMARVRRRPGEPPLVVRL
jgi:hypothetical protein